MGQDAGISGDLGGGEREVWFAAIGKGNRGELRGGCQGLQAGQVGHDIGGGVADGDRRDVRLRGGGRCIGRGNPRHRQGVGAGDAGEGEGIGADLGGGESEAWSAGVAEDNRAEVPGGCQRLQVGQLRNDIGGGVVDQD